MEQIKNIEKKLTTIAENVPKVYEAGKKAEHSDFWDAYQLNGTRTNYYRAFFNVNMNIRGWNDITFRPKYDLEPTSLTQGFMYIGVTDLETLLSECGVTFDTQNCTSFQQCFQGSLITVFPILHFKRVTDAASMFSSCTQLVTIRKIIFESGTNASFSSTFVNCSNLANIDEVEGSIEINISFASSPLTVETMKRIISCLKNYSGEVDDSGNSLEFKYTIAFKSSAFELLELDGFTEEDKAWLEEKGITYSEDLTWGSVIDDLKWNLTLA